MKRFIFFSTLALALPLCAQQTGTSASATTIPDLNGNPVPFGPQVSRTKSASGSETTETMQSINGRMVPMQRVEEKVLHEDASGRSVERIIRNYDPQGNPLPSVRQTIEETKRPDGSSTVETSTYRTDINGSQQLAEKSVSDTRKSDSTETVDTVVQRPSIDGSMETVEKKNQVTVKQSNGYSQDATTYRRDGSGNFYPAVRQTTEHTEQGTKATDSTAEYDTNSTGQLQLQRQSVTNTVTRADGSQDVVVDVYGRNVPGTVTASDSPLRLQEQQLIQKSPGPNDTVTQTVDVRRPTIADPQTLGPAQPLSQTVCKGNCKP